MGNQSSKSSSSSKKKNKLNRRKSIATVTSFQGTSSSTSHGNYDWIEENQYTHLSEGTLNAALNAAIARTDQQHQHQKSSSTISSPPALVNSRRKSITEFFARRKQSLSTFQPIETDAKERELYQRQHYLLKSTRKGNVWAPIESPKVILESGTGNGIWALEMAAHYTDSKIIGMDLSPPTIQYGNPNNLSYNQTNINEAWPVAKESVDYIFQRCMFIHVNKDQWPSLVKEMFRVLKPGGYIELIERDLWHHSSGPVQQAFQSFFKQQCTLLNLDIELTDTLEVSLSDAGFEEVDRKILDIPIGEWPSEPELKQFGFINKELQKSYLKNKKNVYVPKWGISPEDYDVALAEVLEEFEAYQSFSRYTCWIARKPMAPTQE